MKLVGKSLYILYDGVMNNTRLTFNSSTNFTLPIGVFQVLQDDAYYYGFMKNGKQNIGGFLNNLIPAINSERDFRKTQQKIPNKIENSLQMIA